MRELSAVLLVGGQSRRMGEDKATLIYKGRPLWQNQLSVLSRMGPTQVLVSGRSDPRWRPAETIFVADAPPSRGPLSGINAALSRMTGSHLLVLAVDMPHMTAEYLQGVWRKAEAGVGVIPVMRGEAEPLSAIYPAEALPFFTKALGSDDFALRSLTEELLSVDRMLKISVNAEEEAFFANLNDPAAFYEAG